MTITYDPNHPKYLDEADVREELTRVYDLCHGCRLCFKFCTSFPTLFSYIDAHDDQDAGRLTPAQQDQVIEECFQCKLCYVNCPYIPELHEWALDFPRLMLRAQAMRHTTNQISLRDKATTQVMARTDMIGKVSVAAAPVVNKIIGAENGLTGPQGRRDHLGHLGPAAHPSLRPHALHDLVQEAGRVCGSPSGPAAPRCSRRVSWSTRRPASARDLVQVYERNGIECTLTKTTGCCGAPWLHSGDIENFTKVAVQNVKALAESVRDGNDIVVPQPTCGYVLKKDYLDYVGGTRRPTRR